MSDYYTERAIQMAHYMIEHKATVTDTAIAFYLGKDTVWKDLRRRLPDGPVKQQVLEIMAWNKSQGARRGGEATQMKWRRINDSKRKNCKQS